MLKVTQDIKDYWREMGNYFSYPKCCIEYFCENSSPDWNDYSVDVVYHGSGFIPCKKCFDKVVGCTSVLEANKILNIKVGDVDKIHNNSLTSPPSLPHTTRNQETIYKRRLMKCQQNYMKGR